MRKPKNIIEEIEEDLSWDIVSELRYLRISEDVGMNA